MSTILDALRKLQGDREGMAPVPRRDLRSSVLESGPLPPVRAARRPEPKVRPMFAALAGGAIVAASAGLFVFWDRREEDPFERATSLEMPTDATLMAQEAVPVTPPPEPPPRVPEPLVNMAAPPEPPPESAEARYAAFQPPPPQPVQEPELAASSQPLFDTPQTFAPVTERARPRVDDESHGEVQATYAPQKYDPPQIVTRESAGGDSQQKPERPAELESAMDRARQRLAQADSNSTAVRPRRERREEPPPPAAEPPEPPASERSEVLPAAGMQFPVLEVQSVLWHPDPLRRQATILLDGQLTTDAREGDLIGGVLVDRIIPGSVEFRMGQERKRVNMVP